jgi:NAD-dependent dihydropyrimidine dehydrogenase PreA subunit
MGIKGIHEERCIGCGICVDDCPSDVLRMDEAKGKAYIAYAADCMVCYQCCARCPADAVVITPEVVRKVLFPY